ncbi:MAG: hypothetical protein M3178_15030 [Pseudomonadota bacterium]|nr:hypothetical protein [Pseudomonadota bacterium]
MGQAKFKRRVAYHEAGHAVIARVHDLDIVDIDLEAYRPEVKTSSATWTALTADSDREGLLEALAVDVKISLAGCAVDEIRKAPEIDAQQEDLHRALDGICSMVAPDRLIAAPQSVGQSFTPTVAEQAEIEIIRERLWQETVAEVRQHWDWIDRVAVLFISRTRATQADVDAQNPMAPVAA